MAMTSITLTEEQLARLRQHAESSGRSLDEVVREAIDAYLAEVTAPDAPHSDEAASDRAEAPWQPPEIRVGADGARVPIPPAMSPAEAEELLAQPSSRARGDYLRAWLRKRGGGGIIHEPPPGPPDPEWQARFDAALARIRAHVPSDMTPDEIEALITEASEEARQERIANRRMQAQRRFDPAAQTEIDAALTRIREKVPPDLTPEEIDAEIDAAWQEVRQERRVRRGRHD